VVRRRRRRGSGSERRLSQECAPALLRLQLFVSTGCFRPMPFLKS
jgi:hypothetical protein